VRSVLRIVVLLACVAMAPTLVHAQAVIAGTVKDASGAVLPGVTVEAASPELIEKVRTAVSDGTGQYRIEDLRPTSSCSMRAGAASTTGGATSSASRTRRTT
jgi:hypothetical protein